MFAVCVRACMHYHHHSRGYSRPGLTVTTALLGSRVQRPCSNPSVSKFIPIQSEINKTSSKNLGGFECQVPQTRGRFDRRQKSNSQLPSSSKNRLPQQSLGIRQDISCKTKAKNFDRHCSENSKGVLSHLLQSNSHYEHPLRFAPNWFDDVMMTMCNGTINTTWENLQIAKHH